MILEHFWEYRISNQVALNCPLKLDSPAIRAQWPVSRKSRKLCRPEKPFVKLQTANSAKLVFSRVVKGKQLKKTAKVRASRRLRFEDKLRELGHQKRARKVSGLSRNGLLISTFPPSTIPETTRTPNWMNPYSAPVPCLGVAPSDSSTPRSFLRTLDAVRPKLLKENKRKRTSNKCD